VFAASPLFALGCCCDACWHARIGVARETRVSFFSSTSHPFHQGMSGNSNNADKERMYQDAGAAPVEKMQLLEPEEVSAAGPAKGLSMDDGAAVQFDESRFQANNEEMNPLSCCLSILCPCVWLCSCFTVREQNSAVELRFGKYAGTHSSPGVQCS
jgi:hypothetical protein